MQRHTISDGDVALDVAHSFNCTPRMRLADALIFFLFADRYLGDSDTDRREILQGDTYRGAYKRTMSFVSNCFMTFTESG